MQVHGDDLVGAGDAQHVGDHLGDNGGPGAILFVLGRVGEARDHGRHPPGRGRLAGVDHDQELHEVVVDLAASRLDDVDVLASNGLADFNAKNIF